MFDSDELEEARSKLQEAITELVGSPDGAETRAHLAILMGLGADGDVADRETLFFSARVFVEALATREPTVLLFEDIHWADASLLDLLETLATRVRDVPLLFLALARPEVLTERPGWGGGLPAYTALPLDRLTEDAAPAGRAVAQKSDQTAARAGAVALATEGNPLFIEELAASLVERSTADVEAMPTSVRAIVAARLDALPPEERGTPRRRVGRRPGLLARRPRAHRRTRRPLGPARRARAARSRAPRGGLAAPGRPAVRVQTRADPGRRVPDASPRRVGGTDTPP